MADRSLVFAADLDTAQGAVKVDANPDGDGAAADVAIFDVFLTPGGNVDAAGIVFSAIRAADVLFDQHDKKCSSGFSPR